MTDCCIYVRISADKAKDTEDEGMGVARQEEDCRVLAARLGWTVTAVYSDNDISAYSGKTRPGFEGMLDAIKHGQYDGLICWNTDRLIRRMDDLERVIEICDTARVPIKSVNSGELDVSTASGKMVARILGSVARQESEHKAERQKRAYMQRAEAGVWRTNQKRMFGYTEEGALHPREAPLIRQAAADILAGRSVSSIVRQWNAAGITTVPGNQWSHNTFKRLFTNPRYAALCVYRGKVVGPGQWPAVISTDDHAGIVAVLKDKSESIKGASWERKFIGSHRYLCGRCGAVMEMYTHNGGLRSYRCTRSAHLSRRQPALDDFVEELALRFMGDTGKVGALIAATTEDRKGLDPAEVRTRRAALQAQKDELATLFADGILDGPAVRRESAKLAEKIAALDSALAEMARRSPLAEMLTEGAEHVRQRWGQASPDIRGKVLDELFSVIVLPLGKGRGFSTDAIRIVWRHQ
jgi:site-specific DNA recombinase